MPGSRRQRYQRNPGRTITFRRRSAPLSAARWSSAQVVEQLRSPSCRLVTVNGAGGAGKTRLALEAARQLLPASRAGEVFADGIAFVALAAVEGAGLDDRRAFPALAAHVADALRLSFSGSEAPQVQLGHYLREKDLLLVLDNCEHLPVASFAIELLEQAPQLTILATSRGRLNVRGEQVVELDGLAFPAASDQLSPFVLHPSSDAQSPGVDLESYSAVQLFQYNAQAVNPRLTWARSTLAAAARICELVAGLPLGIELAASLVRLMSCEEIARELAASLEFLQSSRSDLPERHQSLRAVFDHSWKLLKPAEQRTLRQLSVCRGGFRRDAAAAIAGASIALLTPLVDNSLVRRVAGGDQGEARYELPELVRQYAAEKLAEAAEIRAIGRARPALLLLHRLARSAQSRPARQPTAGGPRRDQPGGREHPRRLAPGAYGRGCRPDRTCD